MRGKGPFDLVLGGRPCNDLSVVSPARTGINGECPAMYTILREHFGRLNISVILSSIKQDEHLN